MKIIKKTQNKNDYYDILSLFSILKIKNKTGYVISSNESEEMSKRIFYLNSRSKILKVFYSILSNQAGEQEEPIDNNYLNK